MFLADRRPASAKENTMTRLGSQIACVALVFGAALWGCGSNTTSGGASSALDVVPASGAISGWTIDPANSRTAGKAAATATTEIDTEDLIDGAAADFFAAPNTPKQFAWQNYVSTTVTDAPSGASVTLYVLQLPSAAEAKTLYSSLLSASLYSRKVGTPDDWKDPTSPLVGTDSRIQDTGDHWWINFYKGNYYVEVSLSPSAGPAPDFTPGDAATKTAAFSFATSIAGKI
jgi:hypothetical protein